MYRCSHRLFYGVHVALKEVTYHFEYVTFTEYLFYHTLLFAKIVLNTTNSMTKMTGSLLNVNQS